MIGNAVCFKVVHVGLGSAECSQACLYGLGSIKCFTDCDPWPIWGTLVQGQKTELWGGADQIELVLKGNTASAWWKQQQLWPPCMNWQTYITSQLQLTLGTDRTKYYSQASHMVRPHQSSHFYTNTQIGCIRNDFRTFTKRLNFLYFLYLVFFVGFVCVCFLCIINFTITIFLSLFSYPYSYLLNFLPFPML
jgi:hypothetical protein